MKKFLSLVVMQLFITVAANSQWTQIGIDIDGEAAGNSSGNSVSLSADGTTLAIGALGNNGNGSQAGHVRIYKNIAGTWIQEGADIDGEAATDLSGNSVSLSADGSIVAIGARLNDGNGTNAGHVRIYKNIAGTWTQQGTDIDGEAANDQSGFSVSLSADGSIVAIGAQGNDGNGTDAGHVRIYKNIAGTWIQEGADIDGEAIYDQSGFSVSLSADGSIVAIGAYSNPGNGTGHVRIYKNIAGTWTQQGADIDGEAANDHSGNSVSLSADGSIVAIGAPFNDDNGANAGHVRIYKNIAGTWTQQGTDIDGEAATDLSGNSVSLSADGSIVAIGALGNNGNGSQAGHVRIYKNIAGTWTQQGTDIDGEAANDQSGFSVSLSADGSIVAIGAQSNDGTGSNAGHVRVFQFPSSCSAPTITCPGNQAANTSSNSCDAVVTYTVSSTGEPAPDITYSFAGATTGSGSGDGSGNTFNKGTTTVTLTATNSCDKATCTFDVVVTDATPPTFTAPDDITIPFTSTCGYTIPTAPPIIASDNCGSVPATPSDAFKNCGSNVVITRTWTATDACGNSTVQVQTITVTDNNTKYIVYAMKEAKFGENNDFNGSVGVKDANGKADFKKNCDQAVTEFAKAKMVTIQMPSTINAINNTPALDGPNPPANPYAGGGLSGNHTQTIDGTVPAGNFKNLTIKKGVVAQVDGDNYGKLTIEENAIVTFTRSTIDMEDLNVKKGKGGSTTEVKFSQCTAVRMKEKVDIEEDTRINAAGGFKVTFYLGNKEFSVKAGNVIVEANVLAPTGKLKITGGNGGATMSGWYVVEKLHGEAKNVTWNHNTACGQLRGPLVATTASRNEPVVVLPDAFKVDVFPNPTYTDFRLQVNSPSKEPVTVRIIDLSGRTIKQIQGVNANSILTIGSELRGGTYFAEVTQGANRKVLKLIKLD